MAPMQPPVKHPSPALSSLPLVAIPITAPITATIMMIQIHIVSYFSCILRQRILVINFTWQKVTLYTIGITNTNLYMILRSKS